MANVPYRYIPSFMSAWTGDVEGTDLAVYVNEAGGKFSAMVFHGKAGKPDWYYTFRTADQRACKIAEAIAGRKSHAEYMVKRKVERTVPHPLKVGTILHTHWGYDQTNVEFFQVTRLVGVHMVEVREIACNSVTTGYMTGTCTPIPDAFLSPRGPGDDQGVPVIKRADANGTIKFASYRFATVGGGEQRWSSYA